MMEQLFAAACGLVGEAACAAAVGGAATPPLMLAHPRVQHACAVLGIAQDEFRFVWSIAAATYYPPLVQQFAPHPGVSLAMHATWWQLPAASLIALADVLTPSHPLQRWGIILPLDGHASMHTRFMLDGGFVAYLRGHASPFASTAPPPIFSERQAATAARLAALFQHAQRDAAKVTLLVTGADGSGRLAACAHAAAPTHVLSVDAQAHPVATWPSLLQALLRDAQLCSAAPVLVNFDDSQLAPPAASTMHDLVRAFPGPVFMALRPEAHLAPQANRAHLRVTWPPADAPTRQRLWLAGLAALPAHVHAAVSADEVAELATNFALGPRAIATVLQSALVSANHDDAGIHLEPRDVYVGIRGNTAMQLAGLATHVQVTQTWDELVLAPDTEADLRALLARVEAAPRALDEWGFRAKLPRGAGVAALFSGPPGTGKTMVAGLLARQLGLELYQVDVSNIVSKWVGETEKQLSRLFDAAEAGQVLLLFDEADSLFAKRSADVRSATDRYANLEVNYLLQRIEQFSGMAVLTTNLDSSLDPALRRRLAAHIVFAHPDEPERVKLWHRLLRTAIPEATYLAPDIDEARLAREFAHMTGANIRNAVLVAAFSAAHAGTPISMAQLQGAAQSEYRAMGRVLAHVGSRALTHKPTL